MLLSDRYKFYVGFPLKGQEFEVFPVNRELEFEEVFDDKLRAWRYILNTTLCFENNEGHMTYDCLYQMEMQCNVCFKIPIRIEEYCNGEWTDHWNGYLPYKSGDWDNDACRVEIKPVVEDEYTCITDSWKTKKNLLEVDDRIVIDSVIGEIEYETIRTTGTVPSPPAGFGWTIVRKKEFSLYDEFEFAQSQGPFEVTYECVFGRECTNTDPNNSDWTQEGSNWYRPLTIINCETTTNQGSFDINTGGSGDDVGYFIETIEICNYLDLELDNAITLQSAFEKFFEDCPYGVCSDFFGFNEVGDAPNNYEYQKAAQYYQNIALFQASDVIIDQLRDENGNPINDIGTDNATIFCKKFCDFWESWATRFRLIMFFDDQNNCMRIEHETFPRQTQLLNLTSDQFKDVRGTHCLDGRKKYSYTKTDLPLLELFEDQIKTGSPDWDDASIAYNKYCSNDDDDTNEETYRDECTLSDLSKLFRNNEYSDDIDVLESVFAVTLDENNDIISIPGPISGNLILNGPMSWSAIIECLWLNDRPQIHGEMNGRPRTFLSTKPVREQKDIQVCMSCEMWEQFKPYQRVKSIIRHGFYDRGFINGSVKRTVPSNVVSMNLIFAADK